MSRVKLISMSVLALAISTSTSVAQAQVLDEIIVTSQKRAQGLKDVPISISAVTGATIEERSIDSLAELSTAVPNFNIQETQIDSTLSIRGVSTGNNKGFEQSVGMYFDGISYGRSQLVRTPLVDLERVEVLRGPQPTLFGKNAIAGAVNVVSAKPTSEFEGKLSASYEIEHEETQLLGVLSGPIAKNLNGRLTASYRDMDGWIENTKLLRKEPQREELYLRGQLAYDNGGPLDINFKAEYATFDTLGYSMEAVEPQDGYGLVFAGPIAVETNEDWVRASDEVHSFNEMYNGVLTANYAWGDHTITSVTGYVQYDTQETLDVDYTGLDILDGTNQSEKYNQFSQEFRLTSPGGEKFDYIAGVFYQNGNVDVTDQVFLGDFLALAGPPVSLLVDSFWDRTYEQSSDLFSVYAQGDFKITDALTLTAGARFSHETKDGARDLIIDSLPTNQTPAPTLAALWGAVLNAGPHSISGSRSEDNFDPLVRLQYQATDNLSLHASFTQGSKAGGFDVRSNSIPGTPGISTPGTFEFEGENAQNFEIGGKFASDRVQFNATLYQTNYDDLQTQIFDGVLGFLVQNASASKVKGIEADGRVLLSENFEVYGSAAYLDYKFKDFPQSQCAYQETPTTVVGAQQFCDRAGQTVLMAPELTANVGFKYENDISENLKVDFGMNASSSSEYFLLGSLDKNLIEDGFTTVGGQLGLSSVNGNWRLSVIADNLTNERYRVAGGVLPLARTFVQLASGGTLDGTAYDAIYARPRNITFKLDYNF